MPTRRFPSPCLPVSAPGARPAGIARSPGAAGLAGCSRLAVASASIFLAVLLSTLSPLVAISSENAGAADAPATLLSVAPDFTASGLDGGRYRLADLLKRGPVLLAFWTTCCKPCLVELPRLQKIWERHREAGFTLLGVASDDQRNAARIRPTVQSKGFRFPIVLNTDRKLSSLYNVRNYPTTVLIAPDGKVALYRLGFTPGVDAELEERVAALLAAKGNETP